MAAVIVLPFQAGCAAAAAAKASETSLSSARPFSCSPSAVAIMVTCCSWVVR